MERELYVLAELDSLNAVSTALKSTHRIKYTSFSVSRNFLVFGATSGGLYVFRREPCIFLHLLPNKEGSVTRVSVSPDEKFFAFSTVKGAVCILERSQTLRARCIQMHLEHHGSDITALQWNVSGTELFVGDDSGKVSVITATPFVARSMFVLMQLDSQIVQLDCLSQLLLVSTLSRCYVCDCVKEQYRQIGHRPREGEYGACFYADDSHELPSRCDRRSSSSSRNGGEKCVGRKGVRNLKMFCARPGSRLWEVDADGTVLSTHHFKQAFGVPPACVIRPHEGSGTGEAVQNEPWGQQSFNFRKLHVIAKKFVFTFRRDGLYVLDPSNGSVVLWSNSFTDIVDAKTLNDTIYMWTASGNMHAVVMLAVDELLVRLYLCKQYTLCAQLCQQYNDYLMKLVRTSSKLPLLADLGTKLDDQVARRISPLLQEIDKHIEQKQNSQRLKSGIFLVENVRFHRGREKEGEEKSVAACPDVPTRNVAVQKGKSRSLTASPEDNRAKKMGSSQLAQKPVGSTSLPELAGMVVSAEGGALLHRRVPYSSDGNFLVSQVNSKLKAHTKQTNSESTFPPEIVQVLKELKQSVSWKSLKHKWLVLEGKMKPSGEDAALEPLDARPADCHDGVVEEERSRGGAELVHSSSNKSRHRSSHFPALDVSDVVGLCHRFAACEQKGSDACELLHELLDAVSNIHDLFAVTGDVPQSSGLKPELSRATPFPFSHYFSEDIVKTICDMFHLALQTEDLVPWLQDRSECVKLADQFPEHLESLYPESALRVDILLSNFLVIFSELLDATLTLHYLQTSELPCYYLSLCVILDRYTEGSLSDREVLPPPVLLSTIYFMLRMERVETCCELSERACVRDIWYLVLRLQQQMQCEGVDKDAARSRCYLLFLSYLQKMPTNSGCVSKVFADEQLSSYVTAAFEELNSATDSSCVCGFPLLRPRPVHFSGLAEALVLYHRESGQSHLMELCKKAPSLWHLVLPHKRSEGFTSVLPLVIHLDDLLELGNWVPYMNRANCVKTLDLLTAFRAGTCLSCGSAFTLPGDEPRAMSWSSVGLLIVKALGPYEALQLLMKYVRHMTSGELDTRFFQACIYSAILDSRAEGLRGTMVDVLSDGSTGSSGRALFSPAVGPAVEDALKRDLGRCVEFPVAAEKHHWGVKVNIEDGNCPRCALPLGSPVLMKDGGVTTFCCGHSYHEVCLRSHSCPICTRNS